MTRPQRSTVTEPERGAASGPAGGPSASTVRVPDVECRARYFPAPAPGDDTAFYDVTPAAADLDRTCRQAWRQAQDHPGPGPRYLASWGE